uniref:non-specific serine/threonine protein kinase n=1 Tax=Nelumbo nucifera TaxID=4432 RepID=A0A822XK82_NELNU|nr:TPA_asm: hypothetical protein HUJ06_020819 [Nelumbo nucifera]
MSYRECWLFLIFVVLLSVCMNSASFAAATSATTTAITFGGNETDKIALLAFKARITRDPLLAMSSWNDSLHFCKWEGVECGRRHPGRIVSLDLESRGLVGSLAPEIGNLSFLRKIMLLNNSFHGEIPQQIGPNLSRCSNLKFLSLHGNSLTGKVPTELGSLYKLQVLAVHHNNLSGLVPFSLYNLSSLTHLDLGNNQLKGNLPHDIGLSLPNLQLFSVGGNQLTGLVPVSFSNASKLELLNLKANNIFGRVPIDFGGLPHLAELIIGYNHLGSEQIDDLSFMNTMTNCSNLQVLCLEENNFGGQLPNSIVNLSTQLRILALGENLIHGSIPLGIENLVNLSWLGLEQNTLTGSIPSSIGKLQKLQKLLLNGNKLSGQIPSSLGNLTILNILGLNVNNFSGNIPPSLGKCQNLFELYLNENNLSGVIPPALFDLSSLLVSLNLSQNHLAGPLPVEVGQLTNLGELDVSENMLIGEIPSTLGSCRGLQYLSMQGNLIRGSIPPFLGSLENLQFFDLSHNNLSGTIPKYLQYFDLQRLDLSFNNLNGEVPTDGVFQNASAISVIGNPELCGGIPQLHLLACPQKTKEKRTSQEFKLIVIISSTIVILCFISVLAFLILHQRKKTKQETSFASSMEHRYSIVSYEALLKATRGFCSANLIGAGSFGSVYKGIFDQDETIVAIKVLNLQQKRGYKSFASECETLRNIRHRNLVKIVTSCSSIDFKGNDFKALVYEFMPNGSLEEWLHPKENCTWGKPRHLDILQRLNIVIDVASALDYLHHHCQTPIIHCDIKPSNILLDDDFTARVADFGLSRFLLKRSNTTSLDQSSSVRIKGSIGYVPPEYGVGADVSIHGDIYSYGITLLEIFTCKRPTDEIFKDGLNLHDFSKMAFPDKVMEIMDPMLLPEEESKEKAAAIHPIANQRYIKDELQELLISVLRLGVACSVETPRERMDMTNVTKKLQLIRRIYLGLDKKKGQMNDG